MCDALRSHEMGITAALCTLEIGSVVGPSECNTDGRDASPEEGVNIQNSLRP